MSGMLNASQRAWTRVLCWLQSTARPEPMEGIHSTCPAPCPRRLIPIAGCSKRPSSANQRHCLVIRCRISKFAPAIHGPARRQRCRSFSGATDGGRHRAIMSVCAPCCTHVRQGHRPAESQCKCATCHGSLCSGADGRRAGHTGTTSVTRALGKTFNQQSTASPISTSSSRNLPNILKPAITCWNVMRVCWVNDLHWAWIDSSTDGALHNQIMRLFQTYLSQSLLETE